MSNEKEKAAEEVVETKAVVETDASPEMAEAVNEGAKVDPEAGTASPEPSMVKQELTEEEQAQRMKMFIAQSIVDREGELNKLLEELEKLGFTDYMYGNEGTVEIPGKMLAYMLNFMVGVRIHNENIAQVMAGIKDANNSLTLDAITFQLELTQLHKKACEDGVALSPAQVEKLNAERNIKEIPSEKEGKKKARGSEELVERDPDTDPTAEQK